MTTKPAIGTEVVTHLKGFRGIVRSHDTTDENYVTIVLDDAKGLMRIRWSLLELPPNV